MTPCFERRPKISHFGLTSVTQTKTSLSHAYPAQLDEGLADEDEGDEEGEDFLGEAGDEAHQKAAFEGHRDDHDDDEPEADPDAARQVLHAVCFAELWRHRTVRNVDSPAFMSMQVVEIML